MRSSRGFTLIEMSVVIVVLALLAAMVIPNLAAAKDSRLEAHFYESARRISVEARTRAVTRGQTMRLRWSETDSTLEVLSPDESGDGSENVVASAVSPGGVQADKFVLDGNDSNSGEWEVRFYPDGKATEASIEFASGITLAIDGVGSSRLVRGQAETNEVSWEAGQLEQRQ